jgi:hypothetical protein
MLKLVVISFLYVRFAYNAGILELLKRAVGAERIELEASMLCRGVSNHSSRTRQLSVLKLEAGSPS